MPDTSRKKERREEGKERKRKEGRWYLSWSSLMGIFVEMVVGVLEVGIQVVGAMGIQDQAQRIVNEQEEA